MEKVKYPHIPGLRPMTKDNWKSLITAGYHCEYRHTDNCVYRPAEWNDDAHMPMCAECVKDRQSGI